MWDPRNDTVEALMDLIARRPLDRMEACFIEAAKAEMERRRKPRTLITIERDRIGLFGRVYHAQRWEPVPTGACFGRRESAPAHVLAAAGDGAWTIMSRPGLLSGEPSRWYVQVSRHDINEWDIKS